MSGIYILMNIMSHSGDIQDLRAYFSRPMITENYSFVLLSLQTLTSTSNLI